MPDIPLAQYSYRRGDLTTPSVRLDNVYAERSPSNLKTQVDVFTRPSLDLFATIGSGPIRGVFWEDDVFGDDALAASGAALYRVTQSASATLVGTLTGSGFVDVAYAPTEALVATGGALQITDGATLSLKTFPDSLNVVSVGFLNGYFLAVPENSHRIYYTDLITGEFDPTRFISAERYPDNIVRIVINGDEIWAMGTGSVEVFVPTGVDDPSNPPFQRVEARLYKKGALNARAIVEADNSIFWVGYSKDSGIAVYRGSDVPVAISNAPVAERLQRITDHAAIKFWAFGMVGHTFLVLATGAEGSHIFDITTGYWYEWTSYGRDQWRAHTGRGCWPGVVLAGDDELGKLWTLNDRGTSDNSEPIVQVWTAGAPINSRLTNHSLTLDCAVGQGTGRIRLRHSDDQGRTWIQDDDADLTEGDYGQQLRWNRLGTMSPPVRVFEWTITDPVRMRIAGARINEPR